MHTHAHTHKERERENYFQVPPNDAYDDDEGEKSNKSFALSFCFVHRQCTSEMSNQKAFYLIALLILACKCKYGMIYLVCSSK